MPTPDAVRAGLTTSAPYLLATAFPLAMWRHNLAEEPRWMELAATFGLAWVVPLIGEGGWWLLARTNRAYRRHRGNSHSQPPGPDTRAARSIALTLWVVFCLGYGHVFLLLPAGRWPHRQMLAVWLAAWLIVGVGLYCSRRTRFIDHVASGLRWFCPALLLVQFFGTAPLLEGNREWNWPGARQSIAATHVAATPEESPAATSPTARPDVYYIILDAYARRDVLDLVHHFDNGPFIRALRARGFEVPDAARSNYAQTRLSLASSLSMDYLPIPANDDPYEPHHATIRGLRQNSRVARRFRQEGYCYRYVGNPYFPLDPGADEQLLLGEQGDAYVMTFVATTVFGRLVHQALNAAECFSGPVEVHAFQLANLPRKKSRPGPMFAFAHLCCPHAPYVYDRHGPLPQRMPDDQATSRDYIEQLIYLNGRVLELIDAIDRASGPDAVIILQADHGSDDFGVPPSAQPETRMPIDPNERQLLERMSIFCAVRGPPAVQQRLYPGITPVNLFRVVFNGLFADDWPLLPDRSLYSVYHAPFRAREWHPPPSDQSAASGEDTGHDR